MQNLRAGNSEGAVNSGGAVPVTVAPSDLCPNSPECRRKWTYLEGTETAECAFCYQILSRLDMARIFVGTA